MRDKRRRDIDNFFKGAIDSLTAAEVITDDSQIVRLEGTKCDCQVCPEPFYLQIGEIDKDYKEEKEENDKDDKDDKEENDDEKPISMQQADLRPPSSP